MKLQVLGGAVILFEIDLDLTHRILERVKLSWLRQLMVRIRGVRLLAFLKERPSLITG